MNNTPTTSESDDFSSKGNVTDDETLNVIQIYDLNNDDICDFKEFICELIEQYINQNILNIMSPYFNKNIIEEVIKEIQASYASIIDVSNKEQLNLILNECIFIYFNLITKLPRSFKNSINDALDKKVITKQINILRKIPQPDQNTPEWFEFRWNRLTASSAYKTFGTPASYNSLIYSKCKPIDPCKYSNVNITSATHHGHKYEDVSVQFYELLFDTKIEEFGCIADDTYDFIGASPDGINVKKNNNKYGYLLEIKNPVSRKLTGIPKLDYWVQMQQQMYVTKLPYCDFLETIIKDYDNEDAFLQDGTFIETKDKKIKGIIVCFNDGEKPIYKYPPLKLTKKRFDAWYDKIMEENKHLTWVNNTYWYMQEYSCITVPFNKKWFDAAIPKFKVLWDTIIKERIEGYEHRKPKKKSKSTSIVTVNKITDNIIPPKLIIDMNPKFNSKLL